MIDYKKIITSRKIRIFLLNLVSFIPDRLMILLQYRIKLGFWPNLKNPQRFTEKLQCYKLYYRDPLMKQCADKYDVRAYIESIGLQSILNECYGVYENADDVVFDKLPNEFVLKDTLGGGGNSVIVCKDKSTADIAYYRKCMNKWAHLYTKKSSGREWVYEAQKHRIIIEKLIPSDESKGGLIDYKFFCFNGRFEYMYVIADRKMSEKAGFGIYNRNFEKLEVSRCEEDPLKREIPRPQNFEDMICVAEKIAAKFPEARVDLYNVDGKILFGEITFFSGSGYIKFNPDSFDFEMGKKFEFKREK